MIAKKFEELERISAECKAKSEASGSKRPSCDTDVDASEVQPKRYREDEEALPESALEEIFKQTSSFSVNCIDETRIHKLSCLQDSQHLPSLT
mmetsp:Transcript_1828/g.4097  ORF Transcript_1828/g.4097 Transcript_1828/m.4097 type:complete len:93 (+) Transcript_1828:171-449(+)